MQEVALAGRGLAPRLLECLVRLEPGPGLQQREPAFETIVAHSVVAGGTVSGCLEGVSAVVGVKLHGATLAACYGQDVATIKLEGVDLFFRGRLEGLLREHTLTAKAGIAADLVIADISRVDAAAVVAAYPGLPVLGYGNHTDTEGLRRAHLAGFAQVIVKSALVERAPTVVGRLLGSLEYEP